MRSALRVAGDVSLAILGENGVFVSEARQELHVFNTEATYLWCCLEEGLDAGEIATSYASAFEVSQAQSEGCVAEMLHRWQGLGYVSGVSVPSPVEIDFTTALGRLLGSPSLRREFAASPHETARRQAVRKQDLEAFCSLDPDGLERQVAILEAKRAKRKSRSCSALERDRGFLELRASAVADADRCVLLVGSAGGDESPLAAALLAVGFSGVSDGVTVLERDCLRARPPQSAAPATGARPSRALDVGSIVFPRYAPGAEGGLQHLAGAAALQRLVGESLIDSARLDRRSARALVAWISAVDCFDLSYESLSAAVQFVASLRR